MPISNSRVSASYRRGFWSWLSSNKTYQSVSSFLLGTKRKRFILLAALPVLWALVANFAPLLKMLEFSFYEAYPLSKGRGIVYTLDNWIEFFILNVYTVPFLRSIVFSIILTISTLILTYPIAYYLAQHLPKSKQLLFLLILLIPFWVGEIIRTYAIMILLGNKGLINLILQYFDLIEKHIDHQDNMFQNVIKEQNGKLRNVIGDAYIITFDKIDCLINAINYVRMIYNQRLKYDKKL